MIGYCGYNCYLCSARSNDPEIRGEMVEAWRKYLGHQDYTAENVHCEGCKSEGDKIADKKCKARPCAREKEIESCALCDDFPCDKNKHLFGTHEGILIYTYPKSSEITEKEYNYCMAQWSSMPNLVKILLDAGRLPSWLRDFNV